MFNEFNACNLRLKDTLNKTPDITAIPWLAEGQGKVRDVTGVLLWSSQSQIRIDILLHRRQAFNGKVKGVCRVLGISPDHVEFIALMRNFLLKMSPIMELQAPASWNIDRNHRTRWLPHFDNLHLYNLSKKKPNMKLRLAWHWTMAATWLSTSKYVPIPN